MRKIYCFGSDIMEGDRVAFDAADELSIEGIEFIKIKDPYDLYEIKEDEFLIMDAVNGIFFVKVFDDLSAIKSNNPISLHDFDLSTFLALLVQMGRIKNIRIIGLPLGKPLSEIKDDLISTIRKEVTTEQ